MRVWEHPQTINQLQHNLSYTEDGETITIATDVEINNLIQRRFRNYDYLTPSETANKMMLQSTIDMWRDYTIELYKTTIFEYNPIENYDRYEEGGWTDEHHKASKTTRSLNLKDATNVDNKISNNTDVKAVNKEVGYNSATPVETDENQTTGAAANNYSQTTASKDSNYTDHTGTETVTTEDLGANLFDKDKRETNLHIHGNIGVMSTQQMIQQSRDIIIDILDFYVAKFGEDFNISSFIAFEDFE